MRRGRRRHAPGILLLVLLSCGQRPPPLPPDVARVSEPSPDQVDSVIFLLGDSGYARDDNSPLLFRLRRDIEGWAGRLEESGSVTLLVLGDVVYPEGVRPPETEEYHADTTVVMGQVRLVSGPSARSRGAQAYFLAGNHDWGGPPHRGADTRLRNLEEVVRSARERTGVDVRLAPDAGTGGPFILDRGRHLRILLLDTQWWLVRGNRAEKNAVLAGIDDAMAGAGDRHILIAAHHPFRTAGPHGGRFSIWRTAGLRYLLFRSGAILQDITSGPYRDLENGLRAIFARRGPPLAFAGGHEHSLQLISGIAPTDPYFSLVSGSASKLSDVGYEPGTQLALSAPGYLRLVIERDGGVLVFVEATEPDFILCEGGEPQRAQCMVAGIEAFRTVYARRLH